MSATKNYLDLIVEDFYRDWDETGDVITAIDNFEFNASFNRRLFTEAEYNKKVEHLKFEVFDVDRFVKKNDCKQITNPVFYTRNNIPTDDGLLSNKIFGITQEDRAGIFAYIDLGGYYMDPSCYKAWIRLDRRIKEIVHGNARYTLNNKGDLVEDEAGETGINFLRKNISKINFKESDSEKQDLKRRFLEKNRNNIFINKYIVIPPYSRDSNTGSRAVGIGGVNKLYSQLLVSVNSMNTTMEFGFGEPYAIQGRIQEGILALYDWFIGNTNAQINSKDEGVGISGKRGIMRRAVMSKTSNYAARLVISAPELKAHRPEDMMVDFDHSAIPLAAVMATYRPFIQYHVRRFFENEFMGREQYTVMDSKGKEHYVTVKEPMIEFSDERIKREMERFINGYNNRFTPVMIENIEEMPGKKAYMMFRGQFADQNVHTETIMNRPLTWCDIFYKAAVDATKDKMCLITRYPVDSRFNEIATQVVVSSTLETEPMLIEGTLYKYYPKILASDIGTNTGHRFIDTLVMSNLYLAGLGGDYDGDTVVLKGCYMQEVNEELMKFKDSKMNFINLGCDNIRKSDGDVIQSIYCLTKVLEEDKGKLTKDIKFTRVKK